MDAAFFRLFYRFNFFYAVHGLAAGRGLILWAMNEKKLRKKANLWIATAANELNEIRRRWRLTSNRQFARAVGMNERTIAKLNPKQPDSSLSLETVDRIYSALIALRCVYITDEEMEEEYRRLVESRIRIAMSVAPLPQAVKDAVADELQSRGKQTGKC